jgi:hypothetical protein
MYPISSVKKSSIKRRSLKGDGNETPRTVGMNVIIWRLTNAYAIFPKFLRWRVVANERLQPFRARRLLNKMTTIMLTSNKAIAINAINSPDHDASQA